MLQISMYSICDVYCIWQLTAHAYDIDLTLKEVTLDNSTSNMNSFDVDGKCRWTLR